MGSHVHAARAIVVSLIQQDVVASLGLVVREVHRRIVVDVRLEGAALGVRAGGDVVDWGQSARDSAVIHCMRL